MSEGKAAADDDAHSSADDTEDTSEKFGNTSLTNAELRVDDEAWAPMGGREQAYFVQLITQQISYFADKPLYDGRCSIGDYAARFLAQPEAYGWTLDFDPNLFCELAYEGFLSTGMEMPAGQDAPLQILLPWIDPKRNSLDFEDMHISKQVRGRRRRRRKRRRRRSRRRRRVVERAEGREGRREEERGRDRRRGAEYGGVAPNSPLLIVCGVVLVCGEESDNVCTHIILLPSPSSISSSSDLPFLSLHPSSSYRLLP